MLVYPSVERWRDDGESSLERKLKADFLCVFQGNEHSLVGHPVCSTRLVIGPTTAGLATGVNTSLAARGNKEDLKVSPLRRKPQTYPRSYTHWHGKEHSSTHTNQMNPLTSNLSSVCVCVWPGAGYKGLHISRCFLL